MCNHFCLDCRMAKSKSQRMKEYRARKKALLGDKWLRRENDRVKSYFVPMVELPNTKQTHKRALNRKHAQTFRKKQKRKSNNETLNESEESQPYTSHYIEDNNGVSSTSSPIVVKLPFVSVSSGSRQSRGRKRVAGALAKKFRKTQKLEDKNEELRKKLNAANKKLERLKQKQKAERNETIPSTPRSKSFKILRDAGLSPNKVPKLRQKLLYAECISEEIKRAAKSKSNKNQKIVRIVSGKVIKKYKLKKQLADETGLDRRKMNSETKDANVKRRKRNELISQAISRDIRKFLEREDNSRILPGKADNVKVGRKKEQKRVLNDYMYNLHAKFSAEHTYKISHATFCRKKPKEFAHVNFTSRSVCLCQKHQNFALKLRCLKGYNLISITSPDKFMEHYKTESELKSMLAAFPHTTLKYQEWKRKKMKDGKERMRVTDLELPKAEFIAMMTETYKEFAKHIYNVKQQYKGVREMKEKLPPNHYLIQMDFSENYACQSVEEVQSAYWNATSVTLHPTVIYRKDKEGGLEHENIVFVSEVLQHNATMVLAIIEKIVKHVKTDNNNVKAIHFWTDSPTSQYRNKTIFDFVSRMDTQYGIKGSWHYFESGHGKGPCDGVGGTTKRNADNAIKQQKATIQDADDFFRWASASASQIKFQMITQEEFNTSKEVVEKRNQNIIPVKGTMKVHSVIAVTDETIKTRETVCVCAECFGENGFNLSTSCKWDDQNMTKHTQEQSNAIAQDLGENITSNTENDKFIEDESKDLKVAIDDFVILEYDKKYYIGKIESIDEDDGELEVTCMESCGKVEGRYRWPKNLR